MVEYVNKGLFGVWCTGVWGLSWELRESRRAIVLKPIKDLWYGMGVGAWGGFCRGGGTPGKGFSSWRIQSA